jgi:hypothetical protein
MGAIISWDTPPTLGAQIFCFTLFYLNKLLVYSQKKKKEEEEEEGKCTE